MGLNSCRLMVWGAPVKPFKRWHNLLGVISGPPTFKVAWARESPVGGALKGAWGRGITSIWGIGALLYLRRGGMM